MNDRRNLDLGVPYDKPEKMLHICTTCKYSQTSPVSNLLKLISTSFCHLWNAWH